MERNGKREDTETRREEQRHAVLRKLRLFGIVIAGNALYALGVKLFLLPAGLVTGGSTGLALFLNRLTGLPVTAVVFCFNTAMLLLGLFAIGRTFAASAVVSTFAFPASLELLDRLLGQPVLTDDPLLCAIFGGMLIGAALGIVIRSGASTGGMDIPCILLWKKLHLPLSVLIYAADVIILVLQSLLVTPEQVLYGILLVIIYSFVLDKVMILGESKTEVRVISRRQDDIRQAILKDVDRGVTVVPARGGYLGAPCELLMSVISNRELAQTEQLVHDIDPEAFLVVSRVSEVRGRGFSMKKEYR